jgi:hypothetical protein
LHQDLVFASDLDMNPPDQTPRVPLAVLTHTISARLLHVLCNYSWASALAAKTPITVEIFLASIATAFPDETSHFFDGYEFLIQSPEAKAQANTLVNETIGEANSHGVHPMFMIKLDDALIQLLWRAAKISTASGRGPADLPELMGALSLDDQTLREIERNKGVRLKNYLGPPR